MNGRTNPLQSTRILALASVSALLLLLLRPLPSQAVNCPSSPALTSGVPVVASADPSQYSIAPGSNRWSAVAVRASDGKDWNLGAWDATASYPTCLTGSLGSSTLSSSVDLIATDWRFRAAGTDYLRLTTTTSNGTGAIAEFEQATFEVQADMPFLKVPTNSGDLITVYESQLFSGIPYQIHVAASASLTGLKLLVFAPVTSGTGYVPRSAELQELSIVADSDNQLLLTPSVDGMYGFVIVNETGAAGDSYFAVTRCPFSSTVLADNTPLFTPALEDWPSFTPAVHAWGAVGVRGETGYLYGLDVAPALRSATGNFPICTDSVVASQYSGLGVHVIAGDFRSLPLRTYSARVSLQGTWNTSSAGYVEYEDAGDSITVGAPAIFVSPPAHNVLDAWNIRLTAGTGYDFTLTPMGGTAADHLLLFQNPSPGSGYWASRTDAVFQTDTTGQFVPSSSGLYGLVVVNDNPGNGTYTVGVTQSAAGIANGGVLPRMDRISSISPNPARRGAHVAYELARAGRASLVVRDVAGRFVASVALGSRQAGAGTAVWDATNRDGRPLSAGVYFVVLSVDGRSSQGRKVMILN